MKDSTRHQGMRRQLIAQLTQKGISDKAVLDALMNVPRHWFFDSGFLEHAYEDKAFPIGAGQTISQPYTVAYQSQILEVKRGMKVLEVGTGSGYQASILMEMGARVYSIERQKELFEKAKRLFRTLKYNPKLFYGDGYKGLPTYGPFDRIIITAGAPEIPEALLDQLTPDGIMVVPVGEEDQKMVRILNHPEGEIDIEDHGDFRFVPMLKDKE